MPVLLAAHHRLARDPVELNYPAGPRERLMAVPRIVATPEREQRPTRRRHFKDHVLEVGARAQQPEPATRGFPRPVHVNEDGDDFGLGVGVNLTVFLAATSAHSDHVPAGGQMYIELFLKRSAKLGAAHFLYK